jgi:hypothetical protein
MVNFINFKVILYFKGDIKMDDKKSKNEISIAIRKLFLQKKNFNINTFHWQIIDMGFYSSELYIRKTVESQIKFTGYGTIWGDDVIFDDYVPKGYAKIMIPKVGEKNESKTSN